MPTTAVKMARTRPIEPSSTGLSYVPSSRTANSLTGVGVASMTAPPTATSGPAWGRVAAASNSATATPNAADSTPQDAPYEETSHRRSHLPGTQVRRCDRRTPAGTVRSDE